MANCRTAVDRLIPESVVAFG